MASRILPIQMIMIGLLILFAAIPVRAESFASDINVLVINSYHRGFAWSDAEEAGFLERLKQTYPSADISIEFLDTKRFPDQKNLRRMKGFLLSKYRGKTFNLVVVFDNPAIEMLARYRDELYPETPVIL